MNTCVGLLHGKTGTIERSWGRPLSYGGHDDGDYDGDDDVAVLYILPSDGR